MIDWESRYREGDTPWDKGGPHPVLTHLEQLPVPAARVLVPGCGLGYDLVALSRMPGVNRVVGIDVAESAVQAAAERAARLPGVSVERADLFDLDAAHRGAYDLVWEHTCFCAIDPALRNAYVGAVADVLRPGGHLLAVFFLRPWDTDEENATKGPPYGCSADELDRRFAPRFELVEVASVSSTYPGREGREQLRLLRRS